MLTEPQLKQWIEGNQSPASEYTGSTPVIGINDLLELFKGMVLAPVVHGDRLQAMIDESGLEPVAARRLADAILEQVDELIIDCDPNPKMILHEPYRTVLNTVHPWFLEDATALLPPDEPRDSDS